MRQLIALSLLFCCACSTMGRDFTDPEASVVHAVIQDISLFETTMLFTVRVDNENPYEIVLDGGVHRIYLNGEYIGKGIDRSRVRIPRLSSVQHTVPVHISNVSFINKIESLVRSQAVECRVDSVLYPSIGSWKKRVETSHSDTIRLIPPPRS